MRAWVGQRNRRQHRLTVEVQEAGESRPLVHIPYHSPDGFEWGYGGSGPADLALSMLADYFHEAPGLIHAELAGSMGPRSAAYALHQAFKSEVIARQTGDTFRLNETEIARWVALGYNQTVLTRLEADK